MESRIIELRERSRDTIRRTRRTLVIAAGVGAGLGAVAIAALLVYRMRRPPTFEERMDRALPSGWWSWARSLRERFELGYRRSVPSVRLYIGDRQVGEEPQSSRFEKVAVSAARAAGTAMAGSIVSTILGRIGGRSRAA